MLLPAVFFISAAALAFEVLLARIFSISQWNHLSFMVISLALFGFAASGTFHTILLSCNPEFQKRLTRDNAVAVIAAGYLIFTSMALILMTAIPLDYYRLPFEKIQVVYLLAAYLIPSIPFFLAGLTVSLAYAEDFGKSGEDHAWLLVKTKKGEVIRVDPSYREVGGVTMLPLNPEYAQYDQEFGDIYEASEHLGANKWDWWKDRTARKVLDENVLLEKKEEAMKKAAE